MHVKAKEKYISQNRRARKSYGKLEITNLFDEMVNYMTF